MSGATRAIAPEPQERRAAVLRRCACGGPSHEGECADCRKKRLQRSATAPGPAMAPPAVHAVLATPGSPLELGLRARMETRLGHDLSHVRVHTGAAAAASADAVAALAYTVGSRVVFGAGQYAPERPGGLRLLAHELAHAVQQRTAPYTPGQALPVGAVDDPLEAEAALTAERVSRDGAARAGGWDHHATLRRVPREGPQGVGREDERMATLELPRRGEDEVRMHVFRWFYPCPCRNVPDAREGVFYNPDLDNLAIAYRHCRGRTTVDVYGRLESNATAFLSGAAPPTGTARVGIDINVSGRRDGGRVIIEPRATTEGGAGIGGRAQLVYQSGEWRVFLEPDFVRRLGEGAGETPNELQLALGGRIGPLTVRFDFRDLLDESRRSAGLGGCWDVGRGVNICVSGTAGPGGALGGTIGIGGPLDVPETRPERCYQCYCPPPAKRFHCIEDVLPREYPVTEDVPVTRQHEFRYYYHLDNTDRSEDSSLRAQSDTNLAEVRDRVTGDHATVVDIVGYASPEATERHNQGLSESRGRHLRTRLTTLLGSGVALPEARGAGELLGSRPTALPSSRLGDIISAEGFRSAEDLTVLLLGEEIPNPELADQFLSLFRALPAPEDRLAVFGLTDADPIAPQVLDAVQRFERSGGRGRRPWERVFRLLRVGVARVTWPDTERVTRTERTTGSVSESSGPDCDAYGRQAEREGRFPEVDPEVLKPHTSSEDRDLDCTLEPRREDTNEGCDYRLPEPLRGGRPRAPSYAPRPVR